MDHINELDLEKPKKQFLEELTELKPNPEEQSALLRLWNQWGTVGKPIRDGLMGCIMVKVQGIDTGISMWLGIESDGYTHS